MKNILFLLDYYCEGNSANGVCCRNIAEHLAKRGHKVFVGCYRKAGAPEEEIRNGVRIIRTWTMPDIPVHKRMSERILIYLKWLNPFYHLPAASIKDRTEAIYTSSCRVIAEQKIDIVICVHLPCETLQVGGRLKKKFPELQICAYQLDTLSGGNLPKLLPASYARWRRIIWERRLLLPMDRIILMNASREHHERYTLNEDWYKKAVYSDVPLFEE